MANNNECMEKVCFEARKKWLPFYNGGRVDPIRQTDRHFACSYDHQLKVMSLLDGTESCSVGMEGDDEIVCLYVTKDSKYVVTACR